MKVTNYRLPDKTYTEDVDHYVDTWKSLAAPLEEYFGWEAIAFDPGVLFRTGAEDTRSLDVEFIQQLNGLIAEARSE